MLSVFPSTPRLQGYTFSLWAYLAAWYAISINILLGTAGVFWVDVLASSPRFVGTCTWAVSAPKSRDSLRLRRRFLPLPKKIARSFEAPRCAIPSAKKIASEPRFLLRIKWVKMVLAAEFLAIPSSAATIASERRCAILVHSGGHCRWQAKKTPTKFGNASKPC